MKNCIALLAATLIAIVSGAQISVTGTSSSVQVGNNAPAVVVDASLSVSTAHAIGSFTVSISNFSAGDVLAYTGSLPSGVTANYASGSGILTFSGNASASSYQALLRTVTFSTTSSSTTSRTITFTAGDGASTYYSTNGHYYAFISGSFNWTTAKSNAAGKTLFGMQGYLVTVTNAAENTLVNSLSGKGWLGASDDFTHINAATGATTFANQSAAEGNWYWVTGPEKGTKFSTGSSVITYANYAGGEPNNSGGTEHYLENAWAGGAWNDSQVGAGHGYIVEYGGIPGDPSIDVTHAVTIVMVATQIKTAGGLTSYTLLQPTTVVDPSLTLTSTGNITNARVTIAGNFFAGDILSYTGTLPSGVTSSYNSTTGVLSFNGTATPANWQALLRTVGFYSSSNNSANRTITFSVGNLVANSNGHFYESITTAANWATAKANATGRTYMGLTGYLATITSATENDFIKQKIGTDAWIGLSDSYTEINSATGTTTYANQSASEGKWYWVTGPEKGSQITTTNALNTSSTGTPFGSAYNNWNNAEPNNVGSEHYGEIYASNANPGKWNDLNGTQNLAYVVEYGGLSTDPVLTLTANKIVGSASMLPVRGLKFHVRSNHNKVLLEWSTEAETNCELFEVLHSIDGLNFISLGKVNGNGTTDNKSNYRFTHYTPADGVNFYRLKQVDIDGRYELSAIKQVELNNSATATVQPNPARSSITVFLSGNTTREKVNIYNIAGNLVGSGFFNGDKCVLDVSTLRPGVYLVKIGNGTNTLRFIKE